MSSATSDKPNANPKLFIFDNSPEGRILIGPGETGVPDAAELGRLADSMSAQGRVSRSSGCDLWAIAKTDFQPQDGYFFAQRRELPEMCEESMFRRSGAAFQMKTLYVKNKFCGECGNVMSDHEADPARVCGACGNVVYPALSSAVIVAVEKDGMLLLGHNVNFPNTRYSVLAGFVEPGETLEDAVNREVYEESEVRVKNITYFGSQPWPFPNSMMFGFRADWESGEPRPDGVELTDVRWFAPRDLPDIPPPISISRRLIDDWMSRNTR
ncbi:MAG: NAD(+) diphosphatase [Synergistaceae bacterium]|jgi:NAD+ diphosphatase|nr:NAD(+) diphosphatase [Synergistaceae bacterium]